MAPILEEVVSCVPERVGTTHVELRSMGVVGTSDIAGGGLGKRRSGRWNENV